MLWMFKFVSLLCFSQLCFISSFANSPHATPAEGKVILVIHGGTGMDKKDLTPELEKQYRASLEKALKAGYEILSKSGTGIDAVETAIRLMEDEPLFNAGKGAVFTFEGKNELDASIMEGKNKNAGAVAGVSIVKNPISAARAVMEKSPHVFLTGHGADMFAKRQKLEIVKPTYFFTDRRWKELEQRRKEEREKLKGVKQSRNGKKKKEEKGTVGAVALDHSGTVVAGTSTGGMTYKRWGRVGDSPVIGAGTYADNEGCGVSATGHGEFFIRYGVAADINALVKYKGMSVQNAADEVIKKKLKEAGGEGGVVALDSRGHVAMSFNSEGLYRGYVTADGKTHVFLYEK